MDSKSSDDVLTSSTTERKPRPPKPAPPVSSVITSPPSIKIHRNNWLIHQLYVRQEFDECLALIEQQLKNSYGQCEYALVVKALIMRHNGAIEDSLHLFQMATQVNPENVANLKQVGRSLYLLGKHSQALEVYDECSRLVGTSDWEVWHTKGLCHSHLGQHDEAKRMFQEANSLHKHDTTFLQLGKVCMAQGKEDEAIQVFLEALQFSPENPDILTTLGLLYLNTGADGKAFDFLGSALTQDTRNARTILAAGSIIQEYESPDVALTKYRVAAAKIPHSAPLWNNIGMCFFSKQRYVPAISCLKRALYLDPFEWSVAYNLGLVYLNTRQYASAFHYLSAAINLKPKHALAYSYMGSALAKLEDPDNAKNAYRRASELDPDSPVIWLNYAVMLHSFGEISEAKQKFQSFQNAWKELPEDKKQEDPRIQKVAKALHTALKQ